MDGTRQLTEAGIAQAKEMAAFLVREIGRVDIVITSPFARALETAQIMAPALGSHIADTRMLQPDGEPQAMWDEITRLAQQSKDVLVVGHDPSINTFLCWLMGAEPRDDTDGTQSIRFEHGSIAHLKVDDDGSGVLHWFVTPKLIARDEEKEVIEAARALAEAI